MYITKRSNKALTDKNKEILIVAARLFSKNGYDSVPMRVLANASNLTPGALYHYYPDKETLYCKTLEYVFAEKAKTVSDVLNSGDSATIKLEKLILFLTKLFSSNAVFTQLLHRELLSNNKKRIKFLTKEIIAAPLQELEKLMKELIPDCDAHLSATSVIALIFGHFKLAPLFQNTTKKKNGDEISLFAAHVNTLVLFGLTASKENS